MELAVAAEWRKIDLGGVGWALRVADELDPTAVLRAEKLGDDE
jgi:hypothetical protein